MLFHLDRVYIFIVHIPLLPLNPLFPFLRSEILFCTHVDSNIENPGTSLQGYLLHFLCIHIHEHVIGKGGVKNGDGKDFEV